MEYLKHIFIKVISTQKSTIRKARIIWKNTHKYKFLTFLASSYCFLETSQCGDSGIKHNAITARTYKSNNL